MEALFLKLVNMSITASWLVLAIIAVRLIFKKTPKWILCLLWGLVAIRLICPFSFESALSLIPSAEPLPQEIIYTAQPEIQSGVPVIDYTVNPMLESSMTPIEPASANPTQIWSFILSQVWILGMLLMLIYSLVSYLLLKRKVATAIPVRRGIKQSEFVDSPFVLGIIRPMIYLPIGMAEGDMTYVIAHEKAHIRRRDHWWKPLGFLLLSIYWFNPLLWAAYILLCRDIEAACDEKVIREMDKDDRRAYSTALLNCSIHRRRITACPLAFGEVGVKERVKGVMNYKKPAFWVILIALVISIVVAVCFMTNPKSELPITMRADYVNRTRADLKFSFDDKLTEGDYQISEAYSVETLVDGNWQELERISDEEPTEPVYEVSSEDADFHAWSLPNWEESYGRLKDGTYRIKKQITFSSDSDESETSHVTVEFTIGGTADDYVTYTLEDVTPTGAKLYEHEKVYNEFQLIYDGSEGIWLESKQDGQWKYVEPTEYIEPLLKKDRHYINQLIYPSEYIRLDWSSLYGDLPDGTYRIAREVTNTAEDDLRVCTAYVEFTIGDVYTWFDMYSENYDEQHPKDTVIDLPGLEGVTVSYDNSDNEILLLTPDGGETIISSDIWIRNAFLTDLNEDGVSEVCATVQTEDSMVVQIYDPVGKKLHELPAGDNWYYVLSQKADRLCVLKYENSFAISEYAQVVLTSDGLELREIDAALKEMTESVVCVDIWTRKQVCLSSGEELYKILNLLRDLEGNVQLVSAEELEAARKDGFYLSNIVVAYELGRKTIVFSENFDYVWESEADIGYRVNNPEPLRQFIGSITNGVRGQEVSGQPFANVDAPWDWCSGISSGSIESAQAHVCLNTYSYGSTSGSTSTNGWISYETLGDLIRVLNEIPKEAFTPDRMVSKESYRSFFINQQTENSTISLIDGVNDLAVVIKYNNGKVTMLLTEEMEKVLDNSHTYLEPTQVWAVNDPGLAEFMLFNVTNNPPVISYSVGAEYEWQLPLEFEKDGISLELRLPEGWEHEYVTNATDSGIRCRPEGITDGWIYFSYWPGEYKPVEEDRYIVEGFYYDWPSYTSYADKDVRIQGGMSTYGKIWSYERYDLETGDYAIINDGADAWFAEYKDLIQDIRTLSNITVE